MIKRLFALKQAAGLSIISMLLLTTVLLPAKGFALGVGEKAPDFRGVTYDGRQVAYYKDLRGKKPAYLFFWTTW